MTRLGSIRARIPERLLWPFVVGIALGLLTQRPIRAKRDGGPGAPIAGDTLVRSVMTHPVETAAPTDALTDVAARMADRAIGAVVLVDTDGSVCGIVTDRDIAIRGLVRPGEVARIAADAASREVVTVAPDTTIADALRLMADRTVRRLPVVVDGRPVGIVTIGDLAIAREPDSVLAKISAAAPSR